MRFIQPPPAKRGPTPEYMNCRNLALRYAKGKTKVAANKEGKAAQRTSHHIDTFCEGDPPPPLQLVHMNSTSLPSVSTITQDTSFQKVTIPGQQILSPIPKLSKPVVQLENDVGKDSIEDLPSIIDFRKESKETSNNVQKLFVGKIGQMTASQSQEHHSNDQFTMNLMKSAVKVGSQLYKSVVDKNNYLVNHSSATKCARAICGLFGFRDIVTGDQLICAVETDNVGMSPPCKYFL